MHRDIKPGNVFLSRWDVVKLGIVCCVVLATRKLLYFIIQANCDVCACPLGDFGLGTLGTHSEREFVASGVAGTHIPSSTGS